MARNIILLAFPPTPRTHIAALLHTAFRTRDTHISNPWKSVPFRYPDGRPSRPATLGAKQHGGAQQLKSLAKQAIPAFAAEYAEEQTIVATKARCVLFLAADSDRRFPVRVTMRSATGGKVPWYEIETYHPNVQRWVVRQTETSRVRAFEIAQVTRLMEEPDDDDEQSEE
ncbi:hypothetical protein A8H39_00370 [Paraburkholderia fungorum]|nr:hypothetical protein [Paraburkholderia fungorum]MBB5547765.1 hypothetical protein [Paraburkholderia fungorum]PNE59638.1 hypothetical protein A8H39_00370 [Paraburkholderia fungorum]